MCSRFRHPSRWLSSNCRSKIEPSISPAVFGWATNFQQDDKTLTSIAYDRSRAKETPRGSGKESEGDCGGRVRFVGKGFALQAFSRKMVCAGSSRPPGGCGDHLWIPSAADARGY